MPYQKDKIGDSPYYTTGTETRFFPHSSCARILKNLDTTGINVHKVKNTVGCTLTYLDIYSTHVESIRLPAST